VNGRAKAMTRDELIAHRAKLLERLQAGDRYITERKQQHKPYERAEQQWIELLGEYERTDDALLELAEVKG